MISRVLKWHAQAALLNIYGTGIRARALFDPSLRSREDVSWLLVATLPNSGSTAVSKLLQGSSRSLAVTPSGEGQWLLPAMSAPGKRWEPSRSVDYEQMRRVWLSRVPKGDAPVVVIDKSPSNLVRLAEVAHALSSMPVKLISVTRDPYATVASWAKRYPPARVIRDWRPSLKGQLGTDDAFFEALGNIWGEWAAMLLKLRERADYSTSYETLVAAPADFVTAITGLYPELSDIDPSANVSVKDYEAQPLRNMNDEQIASLTPAQLGAVTKGLAPHEGIVRALGYELRG
ncbi:sulfotransferase [Parvularcula marina]|uniref:sulfotransferase n=1 Tax=Parvularcula marina TaxID=2292771 RepID=UPI0011C0468C|nr:sulfotransferase [Parvularcula marina]